MIELFIDDKVGRAVSVSRKTLGVSGVVGNMRDFSCHNRIMRDVRMRECTRRTPPTFRASGVSPACTFLEVCVHHYFFTARVPARYDDNGER